MAPDDPDHTLYDELAVACPLCAQSFGARRWAVVDLDRHPAQLAHLLDGSLQRSYCPHCVGPGVDVGGGCLVVRRQNDGVGYAAAMPLGQAEPAEAIGALVQRLHERLREHPHGTDASPPAVHALATSLIGRPDDLERLLERAWPDQALNRFDPDMLQGPLLQLLGPNTPAEREAVLLAHPDLARPNVERLLDHLAQEKDPLRALLAQSARRFVDRARRLGVQAARRLDEAALAALKRLHERAPGLEPRLASFLDLREPAPADAPALAAEAQQLAHALVERGLAAEAGEVWAHWGDLARKQMGPHRAPGIEQAIGAYQCALENLPEDRTDGRWRTLMNLSACWDERGQGQRGDNVEQALKLAEQALTLAEQLPRDCRGESAMELGLLYTRRVTGDPASNLALARRALDQAVELARGTSLHTLAMYNRALVDVEDMLDRSGSSLASGIAKLRVLAEPMCMQDFDLAQQQNLLQSLASALARRASPSQPVPPAGAGQRRPVPKPASELAEAARLAAGAHDIALQRGDPLQAARLAGLRAAIDADRCRLGQADVDVLDVLALINEAGQEFTEQSAPSEWARNQIRLAGAWRDLADPAIGVPLARQALADAARVLTPDADPDSCRRVQATLGRLCSRAGDWPQAAQAYALACDASERLLAGTETRARRQDEVEPHAELVALWLQALWRAAPPDQPMPEDTAWTVLEAMERGRARLFLDQMGLRPLPPLPGLQADDLAQEARLIEQLQWTTAASAESLSAGSAAEQVLRLRATREALGALWDRMAASGEGGRRHVQLRRGRPLAREGLAQLAGDLGRRTACLSCFVTDTQILMVWLQDGQPPAVLAVPLTAGQLEQQLLQPFERDVLTARPTASANHGWLAFGETLFAPVADRMGGVDELVLVPHGPLHGLPLHALSVGGRPLVQRVAVSYTPSLTVLASVRTLQTQALPRGAPFVGFHALRDVDRAEFQGEAQAVALLHRAVVRQPLRTDMLRRGVAMAPLVHLVCHGRFQPDEPLQSAIVLADGELSARAALALRLRCDLATLSACETGRQQVRHGDELLGWSSVLLQAGAASVLLTLWRVYSDSTRQWMQAFHQAWTAPGAPRPSKAQAFQAATLALQERDPDPRAWAAFMLAGDAR